MGDEWPESLLGDLIDVKHGFAFQGEFIHEEPRGDVLLTPGNFSIGGGFKGDKFKYFDGPVPDEFVLAEGDLLVTMTDLSKQSDTLGFPAFVPSRSDNRRYLHNQRLGKVLVKDKRVIDTRYLHYLMCSASYRHEVLASATGTTVKHTSPDRIQRFKFPRPPLAEQRVIAHILGTLDHKIELNRRMNETLEAIARALFKSWFVDFDPVCAKAKGRDPCLPKHIADLFPDSFVDSELGEIPKGWSLGKFADTVDILGGGTPKTTSPEYWNGAIPWFSVVDAPSDTDVWVIDTEKKITQEAVDNSSTQVLPVGTTIITARGTVGKTALVGIPMAMNQSCYGLRGKADRRGYYTYFAIRELVSSLQQRVHGSVFDTITRDTVSGVTVVVAPASLVEAFGTIVSPTVESMRGHLFESGTLASLRDSLLPKLISGELRVKDAANVIGTI